MDSITYAYGQKNEVRINFGKGGAVDSAMVVIKDNGREEESAAKGPAELQRRGIAVDDSAIDPESLETDSLLFRMYREISGKSLDQIEGLRIKVHAEIDVQKDQFNEPDEIHTLMDLLFDACHATAAERQEKEGAAELVIDLLSYIKNTAPGGNPKAVQREIGTTNNLTSL